MKGIILAGGEGKRLKSLTKVTNKHLLPIYDKPMIYYPIETLKRFGIEDILIISSKNEIGDIINLLSDGSDMDINLTYKVQNKAEGIAHGINIGKDFVKKEPFVVCLGDNIMLLPEMNLNQPSIFTKKVNQPNRFGVVKYDKNGKKQSIVEKPTVAPSNDIIIGLYIFDSKYFDYYKNIKKSDRGEYEIVDILNQYLNNNELKQHDLKDLFWSDAGTFESLYKSSSEMKRRQELK